MSGRTVFRSGIMLVQRDSSECHAGWLFSIVKTGFSNGWRQDPEHPRHLVSHANTMRVLPSANCSLSLCSLSQQVRRNGFGNSAGTVPLDELVHMIPSVTNTMDARCTKRAGTTRLLDVRWRPAPVGTVLHSSASAFCVTHNCSRVSSASQQNSSCASSCFIAAVPVTVASGRERWFKLSGERSLESSCLVEALSQLVVHLGEVQRRRAVHLR